MSSSEYFRKKLWVKLEKGYSIKAVASEFKIDKNNILI